MAQPSSPESARQPADHEHVPCWQGIDDNGSGCGPWCCSICQRQSEEKRNDN